MKNTLFLLLLVLLVGSAFGQSKKKKNKKKKEKEEIVDNAQQPTSIDPFKPKEDYHPRNKKIKGKVTYDARANFYKRMEAVDKAERKAEKEAMKPENKDPLYFGHKRPPKKRPPHKMKFCKVCGIRH